MAITSLSDLAKKIKAVEDELSATDLATTDASHLAFKTDLVTDLQALRGRVAKECGNAVFDRTPYFK